MRLTDCYINLLGYVTFFIRTADRKQPPFDQVKADIQRLISESETCVEKGEISQEDYDLARFAVFAWIDEMVLSSSWKEKNRWQMEKLQYVYFDTADAGERFFEKLNRLGPHQKEVREVYYLCLSLGFMGRYVKEGDELLLEPLKTSNLKLITGSSVGVPSLDRGELFPEAYRQGGEAVDNPEMKRSKVPFFTYACIAFPILLYIALFTIYKLILNGIGNDLLG